MSEDVRRLEITNYSLKEMAEAAVNSKRRRVVKQKPVVEDVDYLTVVRMMLKCIRCNTAKYRSYEDYASDSEVVHAFFCNELAHFVEVLAKYYTEYFSYFTAPDWFRQMQFVCSGLARGDHDANDHATYIVLTEYVDALEKKLTEIQKQEEER